ncbi:hypothetical protein ACSFEV_07645 [Pseudomonas fulva]|uniref:hypothetical protein n=1 Tax=Pseudomonas fulva TaxID=47880 RepID=UPI003EE895BD
MSKERTCIICGAPAKSGEHVFPAALGGRITSRGIYCGVHNLAFGKLVTRLERQLGMMNAALEIRPDRKKQPKAFMFHSKGIKFSLRGPDIDVYMPAPFDPNLVGKDGRYPLQASSVEVAQRWIEENQGDGWRFELKGSGEIQQHYQTESAEISLSFGGIDFLQSVAYIALTTFAQYFPVEVRQDSLDALKEMLQLDLAGDPTLWRDDMVWWDGRDTASVVGENPYEFGHVIAVGVCKNTSRAFAYVSFFSCLSFGVDLGPVEPESTTGYVRMFIDPTSDKALGSVQDAKDSDFNPELVNKSVSMVDMIDSGAASKAMGQLLEKIRFTHAEKAARSLEAQLPHPPTSDYFNGVAQFMEILKPHGQAIFNLLRAQIDYYAPKVRGIKYASKYLKCFIEGDDQQPNGLTPVASQTIQSLIRLFANHMHSENLQGTLSTARIRDFLYGDAGDQLIHQFFMIPVLRQAGIKL